MKITIFILCIILLVLIGLNVIKKTTYNQQTDNPSYDFTNSINNLIETNHLTITKEININWTENNSEVTHNYIYQYNMNLKNTYLYGTIQKDNGSPFPIYLLKDDGKQYYYQDKDWIRESGTAVGYTEELFINDYKKIIKLLKNIKSSTEKDVGTYKVTFEESTLKEYIKVFSNKNDPSLIEEMFIDYKKINPTDVSVYITIENNNLKEILFDLSGIHEEINNYTYYYSIYFDKVYDTNQLDENIPTNILATLF